MLQGLDVVEGGVGLQIVYDAAEFGGDGCGVEWGPDGYVREEGAEEVEIILREELREVVVDLG